MRPNQPDNRNRPAATDEALRDARRALETKRPAEAERIATDLLKTNSGNREAAKVLGYALIMLGRVGEATALLEKAARGSHDPEIDMALGIALRQSGRTDEAIAALKRAVKRKPPFPMAFYELGQSLAALGRIDEAIDVFTQGCTLAPGMADMAALLGKCYLTIGDRKNAADSFRPALSLAPGHYAAAEALAVVLTDDRAYTEAAPLFRALVTADPGNAHVRLGLANCLVNLGDDDGARAAMRAASARGPKYYGQALRIAIGAARGRFWLRPSAAAKAIKGNS